MSKLALDMEQQRNAKRKTIFDALRKHLDIMRKYGDVLLVDGDDTHDLTMALIDLETVIEGMEVLSEPSPAKVTRDDDLTLNELWQKYREDPHLVLYILLLAYTDDLPILRGRVSFAIEVIRGAWLSYCGPRLAR